MNKNGDNLRPAAAGPSIRAVSPLDRSPPDDDNLCDSEFALHSADFYSESSLHGVCLAQTKHSHNGALQRDPEVENTSVKIQTNIARITDNSHVRNQCSCMCSSHSFTAHSSLCELNGDENPTTNKCVNLSTADSDHTISTNVPHLAASANESDQIVANLDNKVKQLFSRANVQLKLSADTISQYKSALPKPPSAVSAWHSSIGAGAADDTALQHRFQAKVCSTLNTDRIIIPIETLSAAITMSDNPGTSSGDVNAQVNETQPTVYIDLTNSPVTGSTNEDQAAAVVPTVSTTEPKDVDMANDDVDTSRISLLFNDEEVAEMEGKLRSTLFSNSSGLHGATLQSIHIDGLQQELGLKQSRIFTMANFIDEARATQNAMAQFIQQNVPNADLSQFELLKQSGHTIASFTPLIPGCMPNLNELQELAAKGASFNDPKSLLGIHGPRHVDFPASPNIPPSNDGCKDLGIFLHPNATADGSNKKAHHKNPQGGSIQNGRFINQPRHNPKIFEAAYTLPQRKAERKIDVKKSNSKLHNIQNQKHNDNSVIPPVQIQPQSAENITTAEILKAEIATHLANLQQLEKQLNNIQARPPLFGAEGQQAITTTDATIIDLEDSDNGFQVVQSRRARKTKRRLSVGIGSDSDVDPITSRNRRSSRHKVSRNGDETSFPALGASPVRPIIQLKDNTTTTTTNERVKSDQVGIDASKKVTEPKQRKPFKKPPPISVTECRSFAAISDTMAAFKDRFTVRSRGNTTQIFPLHLEDHAPIQKALHDNGFNHFTHDTHEFKQFRVVLWGLDALPIDDVVIPSITEAVGSTPLRVSLATTRRGSHFYIVNFRADQVDANILAAVHTIDYYRVKWEAYKKRSKGPTQCSSCCAFGHGQQNCSRILVCLLCAEHHHFSECPIKTAPRDDQNALRKCINCAQAKGLDWHHSANWVGCPSRMKFIENRARLLGGKPKNNTNSNNHGRGSAFKGTRANKQQNREPHPNHQTPNIVRTRSLDRNNVTNNVSYADAVRGNPKRPQTQAQPQPSTTQGNLLPWQEVCRIMMESSQYIMTATSRDEQARRAIETMMRFS